MPETDSSHKSDNTSSQLACSSSGLRIGGMCLNWKVIGGLAAVGLGIWVVAPNLVAGVVPLLIFAACPLSMWLMMRGMSGGQQNRAGASSEAPTAAQAATEIARPRDLAVLKAEHARLTAELEALESNVARAKIERSGSPNGSKDLSASPAGPPGAAGGDVA